MIIPENPVSSFFIQQHVRRLDLADCSTVCRLCLGGKGVTGRYAVFLENAVLPNAKVFGFVVAYGEVLVGLGLILGLLTGIAAFFGGFMNVSFLFAGTLSTNPLLFVLATWLALAWKNAGWYGLDRWALPYVGTP